MRVEWIYVVICESAIKGLKYWIYRNRQPHPYVDEAVKMR